MNIVEAFKVALDTGKTVSTGWSNQYDMSSMNQVIFDLTVADILSNEWEVVEPEYLEKNITPNDIREACAKKKLHPTTAQALIDYLWPKKQG